MLETHPFFRNEAHGRSRSALCACKQIETGTVAIRRSRGALQKLVHRTPGIGSAPGRQISRSAELRTFGAFVALFVRLPVFELLNTHQGVASAVRVAIEFWGWLEGDVCPT